MYSIFLVLLSLCVWGQKKYPIPPTSENRLFYIQHSEGINTFIYDVNLSGGKINHLNPILIKRINYESKGEIEPLSITQKKLAYGIKSQKINDNKYAFTLAAYKPQILFLVKKASSYRVETVVNNKKISVDKLYVQTKVNNVGITPKVNHIVFYGTEIETGKSVIEKILIKD